MRHVGMVALIALATAGACWAEDGHAPANADANAAIVAKVEEMLAAERARILTELRRLLAEQGRGTALARAEPGFLGVACVTSDRGLEITQVIPETPAALAGLLRRDVIESVNGQPVKSLPELKRVLTELGAGARVVLSVWRGSQVPACYASYDPGMSTWTVFLASRRAFDEDDEDGDDGDDGDDDEDDDDDHDD